MLFSVSCFLFFTETAKIFGCILAWKEYTDNIMKY